MYIDLQDLASAALDEVVGEFGDDPGFLRALIEEINRELESTD
ncbi:hypothetical protein [Streptomyces regalis]|nr:hypothetical protein [Streptomyces regalis]